MMRVRACHTVAVVIIALAIALSRAAGAAEPFRLGVALGLTGTGEKYSSEALEGIRTAVREINATGGLLGGHPIELFVADTRTDAKVAVARVRQLIEKKKVRAVIGTYSSAAALAIKPICRDAGVLHIATVSNSEDITKLDFSPYTFSVVPNTYMMAKTVALGTVKLAREKGWKTFATIASDYAWGRSSQGIQVALLKDLAPNIKLVGEFWPSLGYTGFNAFAIAVQNAKPDFILESIAGTDNTAWNIAVREYRLYERTARPGPLISVSELIRRAKALRRGTYGRTRAPFFAHMDESMMVRFVDLYRSKYGRYPTDWAVMSYDGVQVLRQGIEQAGTIETDAVKAALRGKSVETTRGRLRFRLIDNQLSASAYFGRVADAPDYGFPIYQDLVELKGPDIWRPEEEILAARGK